MIEQLIEWDKSLFLFLNGLHSPFWDEVMYYISDKYIWIPLYLLIVGYLIFKYKVKSILYILMLVGVIVLADQLSVHLFKNVFERYRPCRLESDIHQFVHIVKNHCGGKYGFISSHAANTFGLATFVYFLFRKQLRYFSIFMLVWASVVSYSRIYLGVHYTADVFFGALFGMLIGFTLYLLAKWLEYRFFSSSKTEKEKIIESKL